jgi:hypothetical protein
MRNAGLRWVDAPSAGYQSHLTSGGAERAMGTRKRAARILFRTCEGSTYPDPFT